MKPREVIAMCREKEVKAVDLRFVDFLGTWQHFTIPVAKLEEEVFEDGIGFDGSSIRGWQAINESDMLLVPVPDTAFVDPFTTVPTLAVICMVQDPITREDYSRDPRFIARKAAIYLEGTGIADSCFIGPEAEFFVFDAAHFDYGALSLRIPICKRCAIIALLSNPEDFSRVFLFSANTVCNVANTAR